MENLFLRVLNMSISAAAVIAVVVILRLFLRSAPKKWRYLLWSAAGFRLCCPVSFKAVFSLFCLRPSIMSSVGEAENFVILPQSMPSAAQLAVPAASAAPAAAVITPAAVPAVIPAASGPLPEPVRLWPQLGIVLWLCGMTVMLILGIIRYIRMKRVLADAATLEKGVFATDRIRVPFILGLLPPRVYVPAGLGEEERTYVLAHERVHIRRGDHWVKLLAYLLLAVHWFNPAVWAAFFLMSRDMEMSCDERVLRDLGGQAKAYSRTLLRFAEGRQFPAPAPLGFGESDVKSRIKNALRWKKPKLWITLAATVLCIAAVAACTADPKEPKETDMQVTAGDTVCFSREDETICLRGTKESRNFGEILEELALTGNTSRKEDNTIDCLLAGQASLTIGMDKDSVLLALYDSQPYGTRFRADTEPGILLGEEEDGYSYLTGVFAGVPFSMTLRYNEGYTDLLRFVTLRLWPVDDGEKVYSRVKEVLIHQLGEPDTVIYGGVSAGWKIQNGFLSVDLTTLGGGDSYVRIRLFGAVESDTPWSWSSTVKALDIREAALKSGSVQEEVLLTEEQIGELTALLNAVPRDQVVGGRGIPSQRVLELRDTGYALRFEGGMIELDCERPAASASPEVPTWEIHDEDLYAWLEAQWAESPFGQTDNPLGLTMRAENITSTGCTLVITQSGDNAIGSLTTGEKFSLLKRGADGKWRDLFSDMRVAWPDLGLPIAADGTTELETNWGWAFTLEEGKYRIEKEIVASQETGGNVIYSICVDFEIPGGREEAPLGLTLRAEDVTSTGCTLVITQSGGDFTGDLVTGAEYLLETMTGDGTWSELPGQSERSWYLIGYQINRDATTTLETDWTNFFGPLADGHYRISKGILNSHDDGSRNSYRIYAEFDISGEAGGMFPGDTAYDALGTLGASQFNISSDEFGTAAKGTIMVYAKSKDTMGVRIMGDLQIGPEDRGGIAFSLPAGCRLESVSCTYPETDGKAADDSPVNVWTTEAENEKYTTMIEIGRDRSRNISGGGTGTVVIEASCPWNSRDPVRSLTFGVECSAEEKDGYVIMGVEHSEIIVEIRSP